MVVLRICTKTNPYIVYFDQPLTKPSYIRLISCTLYNSWYNLKKRGEITWFTTSPNKEGTVLTIAPGNYDLTTIKRWIDHVFRNEKVKLDIITNESFGGMFINKYFPNEVKFDRDLSELLGINQK